MKVLEQILQKSDHIFSLFTNYLLFVIFTARDGRQNERFSQGRSAILLQECYVTIKKYIKNVIKEHVISHILYKDIANLFSNFYQTCFL